MANIPLAQWTPQQPVDWSPIDSALVNIGRQNAVNRDTEIKQAAGAKLAAGDSAGASNALFDAGYLDQGINLQTAAATQKRNAQQDQALIVYRAGGLAQIGMQQADPARKAAILNRITALDPKMKDGIAASGVDISNPDEVFKYVANEAAGYKGYQDPADIKAQELGNQKTQAEIEALKTKADDPIATFLAARLKNIPTQSAAPNASPTGSQGNGGPPAQTLSPPQPPSAQPQNYTPPAPPSQPLLQQTSNTTDVTPPQPVQQPQSATPQLMPGVTLASDDTTDTAAPADQGPAQPSPGAVYSLPGDATVNTPLGPMTRDQARTTGALFAAKGKGDLGKMMIDAASGGGGEDKLSKAGQTQNDKEEIGSTNQLATLNSIKSTYNAKFLNIPTRFKLWGAALADKVGMLNPQDKADLTQYSQFRQAAWHNLNRVLKDLSGTAVTGNELERQLNDLPNPGSGIFDGDSPTQFEAKMNGATAYVSSAIARSRYLRNQGFQGKPWDAGVAVEDMPAIINQRGAQIEQQIRQTVPKATPMQLQQAVQNRLHQEFGI